MPEGNQTAAPRGSESEALSLKLGSGFFSVLGVSSSLSSGLLGSVLGGGGGLRFGAFRSGESDAVLEQAGHGVAHLSALGEPVVHAVFFKVKTDVGTGGNRIVVTKTLDGVAVATLILGKWEILRF